MKRKKRCAVKKYMVWRGWLIRTFLLEIFQKGGLQKKWNQKNRGRRVVTLNETMAQLKAVLLEISLDWRNLITILRDISAIMIIYFQIQWILPHLKQTFSDNNERLFAVKYCRNFSLKFQGSWIRLLTVTSSFCSMSRLAGWFLLRKST